MRVFIDWFNEVWKSPSNALEDELERGEPDRVTVEELGRRIQDLLDVFEPLLEGRDYLWGDDFSAADCAAFPFLKYALRRDPADEELYHRVVDTYQELGSDHPNLRAWIERVDERPREYGETVEP